MKTVTVMMVALALLLGGIGQATVCADMITASFPEFNGATYDYGTTFPLSAVTVATETFTVPPGQQVSSAALTGIFGSTSTYYGSTAEFDLLLNGVQVGSTYDVTPDPYNNVVPFDFTIADLGLLSSLNGGTATLSVVQESPYNIRLSATELTMQTSSSTVPEPSVLISIGSLLGTFAIGFGLWRKRKVE